MKGRGPTERWSSDDGVYVWRAVDSVEIEAASTGERAAACWSLGDDWASGSLLGLAGCMVGRHDSDVWLVW